jgi:hypothetical protein
MNDFEKLKQIVKEQFESTPDYVVSVGWGYKYVNGQVTDDRCLSYMVRKKLPIDQVPESELIPKTLSVSGMTLKTDVVQGIVEATQDYCNAEYNSFRFSPPPNRNTIRPIQGGVSTMNYTKFPGAKCTLGFLAVDNDTNSIVGVSNNHCYTSDSSYGSERNLSGLKENQYNNIVVQSADAVQPPLTNIGVVKKYVPLTDFGYNRVDGACTTLDQAVVDCNVSWKQFGLTGYTSPMRFATTSEINSLSSFTSTSPLLFSSGRTTGAKGEKGNCRLVIDAFPVYSSVYYRKQGNNLGMIADFENQIKFRLSCPDYSAITNYCYFVINPGDSGSALLYDDPITSERRILGLVYACQRQDGYNEFNVFENRCYTGFANRIDDVANELNLSAWTGQTVNVSNPATSETLCLTTNGNDKSIVVAGKTYWQLGLCL